MSDTPAATSAVFLSYASQDAEAARRICEALRAAGIEVWFDQNELVGGDAWDQKIRGQIGSCALFVPVISAATQARLEGYFRIEWKLAAQRTHAMADEKAFLLPVVIDGTRDAEAKVPAEFKAVQWSRLPDGEHAEKFCARVKSLLGGSVAGVADPGPASPRPATPKRHSRAWVWVAAAVAILLVGAAALYQWLRPPAAEGPANLRQDAAATSITPPPAAVDPKSVAVLPFTNMSEEKDSGFFADGMHEDILTNLALVRDLRVVSRTSVMEYRGTTKKIRQIAQELGVAYILEGSVRRLGNKVRVTGQLIRAATDEHVWAKSYDRDLTDIFAIQSELSQAIASALSAALSPQEKSLMEQRPTANLAAYDLYLKGRAFFGGMNLDLSRAQAEAALTEAVKLDPGFADAWGYLARAHASAIFLDEDNSPERLAKAKAAIDTAVRLAPDDPVVVEMLGTYYYYGYRDYERAAEQYQRLLLIRPNSAEAFAQLGYIMRRQARWAEALANLRHAVELDPRNTRVISELGMMLLEFRHYDEATSVLRRAAEIAPDNPFSTSQVTIVPFLARGSTKEFQLWFAGLKETRENANSWRYFYRYMPRFYGDWPEAVKRDQEYPYLDPFDSQYHWQRDQDMIVGVLGTKDLAAVRVRAEKLIPQYLALLEAQPANATLWGYLALLHAFVGHGAEALRCAHKAVELIPESVDAVEGPKQRATLAQVYAWTGDKDRALAEVARLLRTPFGLNVYSIRSDPIWLPLVGDPRFEALLIDPQNNAPLF
jgi:TolB-like protein/Tfp pilus assembly protein PilF